MKTLDSPRCQEFGLLRPLQLCSWFLINTLPYEMLCIWKFFSNTCSYCLNTNYTKAFVCVDHNKLENSERYANTTLSAS